LHTRSSGSILERSIVGGEGGGFSFDLFPRRRLLVLNEGGFSFDLFPRRLLVLIVAMMMVIDSSRYTRIVAPCDQIR
jgi:hypothetical protein